jgi:ubiquinone biosynthesis monooxygenase Coq7
LRSRGFPPAGHLDRLPSGDSRSRAIIEVMRADEQRHAEKAGAAGASEMPAPLRWLMRGAAKMMTLTAHRV